MEASPTAIHGLVADLGAEFRRDARGPKAAEFLRAYARGSRDWERFAHFAPARYTRNLVELAPEFELLVLCWEAGATSPIHNHEGQNCWMAVLEGEVEEIQYRAPSAGARGPLEATGRKTYASSQVGFIRDEVGLHLVRPVVGRAVSLHLYARPIPECNVYCERTGTVERRRLEYHSVRGKLAAPAQA